MFGLKLAGIVAADFSIVVHVRSLHAGCEHGGLPVIEETKVSPKSSAKKTVAIRLKRFVL